MTAIASDMKHLFLRRSRGQSIVFEVRGCKFVIQMGDVCPINRKATLDILAPSEVIITRAEKMGDSHG